MAATISSMAPLSQPDLMSCGYLHFQLTSDHFSSTHNWYTCSHARPTFCNVCREALSGVTSHGLSCEVCKFKVHKRCAVRASSTCKWTTLATIGNEIIEDEDGVAMPHQWLEGNLPVNARCASCDRMCGSVRRLQDYKCLWCKAIIHGTCRDQFSKKCPLGQYRVSILPPTVLNCMDSDGFWKASCPGACSSPLLAFVNSKSGDNQGVRFLRKFKQFLNPAQVFDLMNGGPHLGLRLFQRFSTFRILVCGGDGSVGWVLSEIDTLGLHKQCQLGVLPLGTGNDLARVLGWGSLCDDDTQLLQILEKMERATTKMLDRWSVLTWEAPGGVLTRRAGQGPTGQYMDSVASYLAKLLGSDEHSVASILPASQVLGGTIDEFVVKVGKAHEKITKNAQETEAIARECTPVSNRTDMLIRELEMEPQAAMGYLENTPLAAPAAEGEDEGDEDDFEGGAVGGAPAEVCQPSSLVPPAFRSKDQMVLRANSLKKALRQIIEQAEQDSRRDTVSSTTSSVFLDQPDDSMMLPGKNSPTYQQSSEGGWRRLGMLPGTRLAGEGSGGSMPHYVTRSPSPPSHAILVAAGDCLRYMFENVTASSWGPEESLPIQWAQCGPLPITLSSENRKNSSLESTGRITPATHAQGSEMPSHPTPSSSRGPLVASGGARPGVQGLGLQTHVSLPLPDNKHIDTFRCSGHLFSRIPSWHSILSQFSEKCVMNNYFGIGLDAKISLEFNNKRDEHPKKCSSRTKNMMWYGVLGTKELLQRTYKNLEQRVQLECDGEIMALPSLQGIAVLNIPSYAGGINFWGGTKEDNNFGAPSFDDKKLEVVAVFGSIQMAVSRVINLQHHRIAQCRVVKITICGDEGVPVQVDGEAWVQPPGIIKLQHKNRAQMLTRDRAFESTLKSWEDKQKGESYRSTRPRLSSQQSMEYLTEEEYRLLQRFARSADILITRIREVAKIHKAIEQELAHSVNGCASALTEVLPSKRSGSSPESLSRNSAVEVSISVKALYNEARAYVEGKLPIQLDSPRREEGLQVALANVSQELEKVSEIHWMAPILNAVTEEESLGHTSKGSFRLRLNISRGKKSKPPKVKWSSSVSVDKWGPEEVASWLDALGLGEYKDIFTRHEIQGSELILLERRDLKDLGIRKVGHTKKILQGIKDISHNL
ncbi:diacylglycerol kinase delta-like [Vombatus ursinus]|uniref:diacylglycerol kinase delta-like n=1 Tax=Vombatus ursinus TaxID=29139 RepID=UPI000FFDA061|nr:diacylglycerol kinase delta-like [Vombatus ursinus]